jgi:hypothetical protein
VFNSDEAMKQRSKGGVEHFITYFASLHYHYDFLLSVKCFIAITFEGKSSFNAPSLFFFKDIHNLTLQRRILLKLLCPPLRGDYFMCLFVEQTIE